MLLNEQQTLVQAGGGAEANGGMALRPELGVHAATLSRRLGEVVARPGSNTSVLLVGPRGVGKTLVRNAAQCFQTANGLALVLQARCTAACSRAR